MVRLIDGSRLLPTEAVIGDRVVWVVPYRDIYEAPTVDAIPVEWLEMTYPLHGVSGTEAYFRNASAVKDILRDWELSKRYAQETQE